MRKIYRLCSIIFLLILVAGVGGGKTAVFAQNPNDAKWVITAFVQNGDLHVLWTVNTWHLVNGEVIENESTTPLACAVDESITVQANSLLFTGDGGIQCAVPSFQMEVAHLTNGNLMLPAKMPVKGIYSEATLAITDNTPAQRMNLFTHPNFTYRLDAPKPTGMLQEKGMQRLDVGKDFATASGFTFMRNVAMSLGIYQQLSFFNHEQNGTMLQSVFAPGTYLLDTGAKMVCIGCGGSANFVGEVERLEADPGCTNICGS